MEGEEQENNLLSDMYLTKGSYPNVIQQELSIELPRAGAIQTKHVAINNCMLTTKKNTLMQTYMRMTSQAHAFVQ